MNKAETMQARTLRANAETLSRSKDEEYAYWQSRPAIERLLAMQELSFASFEGRDNEADIRRRFLQSPRCLSLASRQQH